MLQCCHYFSTYTLKLFTIDSNTGVISDLVYTGGFDISKLRYADNTATLALD